MTGAGAVCVCDDRGRSLRSMTGAGAVRDALSCYFGDDAHIDDTQCSSELQSSCSNSTSTDLSWPTSHLTCLINSSAYRPLSTFKM